MLNKSIKTKDLFCCKANYLNNLFDKAEYPWEMLPMIKEHIKSLISQHLDGFTEIAEDVWVGKDVVISPTATINGPAIIGKGTEIRPGAYIRGNVITGQNCVVGNSTELKNCILLDKVQVPHYNYVGDSVLGNHTHMGAGAICSNLKSDGKNIVIHGDEEFQTGMRKIGAILGDNADIGCGCVLNPGTIVGQNTSVYPLTSLRGVYPANCIVKSQREIIKRKCL